MVYTNEPRHTDEEGGVVVAISRGLQTALKHTLVACKENSLDRGGLGGGGGVAVMEGNEWL